MSTEISQPADVLSSLARIKSSNLIIYADTPKLFEEIDPDAMDVILNAYHAAYIRYMEQVCGDDRSHTQLTAFPQANIVITHNPDVFRSLYPEPSRFDKLPDWVRGYVNTNMYVRWLKDRETFPTDNIDGSAHEFIHVIIPEVLGLPTEYLDSAWPLWIHEALAVGLNQQRPIDWLRREIQQPTIIIPTIASIEKNGIFHHDRRPPKNNIAYQYCCFVSEEVGTAIKTTLYPELPNISSLMAICALTQRAYRNDVPTFADALDSIGVDTIPAENRCRKRLGIAA